MRRTEDQQKFSASVACVLHPEPGVLNRLEASGDCNEFTAQRAADRGANVVLVSRNGEAMERICEDIRRTGGHADFVVADVGVREQVRNVVDTVLKRHGGFDTWINNADVGVYATLTGTTDEDHERIFRTNYWGVV